MAATATKTKAAPSVVQRGGQGIAGRGEVIERMESVEVSERLANKIAQPPARFHEMQITPEDAMFIITHYEYPRQRNVRHAWAVELGTLIEEGKFLPTSIHFAHSNADGKIYLVDGYHRMAGIALSKRQGGLLLPVEHHYCRDMDEVHSVYSMLDQGVPRDLACAIRAAELDKEMGLPESFLERVAAAVQVINHNFRAPYTIERIRSSSKRMELVGEWAKEAQLVYAAQSGGNNFVCQKLGNSAFLAVELAITRYQPERATEFIRSIATMQVEDGSGASAMLQAIVNRAKRWGRNVPEQARLMASAWNAHYSGRATSVVQVKDAARPIDLLGTIWAGPLTYTGGAMHNQVVMPYEQKYRDVEPADLSDRHITMPEEGGE